MATPWQRCNLMQEEGSGALETSVRDVTKAMLWEEKK